MIAKLKHELKQQFVSNTIRVITYDRTYYLASKIDRLRNKVTTNTYKKQIKCSRYYSIDKLLDILVDI